jgi:hypothetical protein
VAGANGELIAVGHLTTELDGGDSDETAWIAAFDRTGAKLWQKTYGGAYRDVFHTAVALPDGGLVLAGARHHSDEFGEIPLETSCWILRVDARGAPLWERTFRWDRFCEVVAIDVEPGRGVALAGSSGLIASVDLDGNTRFATGVDGVGRDSSTIQFQTVSLLPDGGVLVAGSRYVDAYTKELGSWILLVSSAGEIVRDEVFFDPYTRFVAAFPTKADAGGAVLLAGSRQSALHLVTIDAAGAKLSARAIELASERGETLEIGWVGELADGAFMLAGSIDGDGWICVLDRQGRKRWEQTFGAEDTSDWIDSLVALPGGGWAAAGTRTTGVFGTEAAWLFAIEDPPF